MWVNSTTVAKLLGWPSDAITPDQQSEIDMLIDVATNMVHAYIGRDIRTQGSSELATAKILVSGEGLVRLRVPQFVRLLTQVEELGEDLATWTTLSLNQFVLKPDSTSLYDGSSLPLYTGIQFRKAAAQVFTPGDHNYRLTGNFGMLSAPMDIKAAMASIIRHLVDSREASEVIRMQTSAGRTTMFNNDSAAIEYTHIPREAKAALRPYRISNA